MFQKGWTGYDEVLHCLACYILSRINSWWGFNFRTLSATCVMMKKMNPETRFSESVWEECSAVSSSSSSSSSRGKSATSLALRIVWNAHIYYIWQTRTLAGTPAEHPSMDHVLQHIAADSRIKLSSLSKPLNTAVFLLMKLCWTVMMLQIYSTSFGCWNKNF